MVKELLKHGADPNLCESAAVVAAANAGYIKGIQLLIKHGADIISKKALPVKLFTRPLTR